MLSINENLGNLEHVATLRDHVIALIDAYHTMSAILSQSARIRERNRAEEYEIVAEYLKRFIMMVEKDNHMNYYKEIIDGLDARTLLGND